MPRRATPGDRAKIEAALPAGVAEALAWLTDVLEVPHGPVRDRQGVEGWQGWVPLQAVFETAAAAHVVRQLEAGGVGSDPALRQAAESLGMSPFTIRSRLDRAFGDSRKPARSADTHYERSEQSGDS